MHHALQEDPRCHQLLSPAPPAAPGLLQPQERLQGVVFLAGAKDGAVRRYDGLEAGLQPGGKGVREIKGGDPG